MIRLLHCCMPELLVGFLVLSAASAAAQTQTPGQITQFDPSLNVVDSVITQDPSGNIGIGTTTPAAALDVASGELNIAGNLLKGGALFLHNSGTDNTFLGLNAGNLAMTSGENTASGAFALAANTTGANNTASGWEALANNTTCIYNTASGFVALGSNCSSVTPCSLGQGSDNTASEARVMARNSTGSFNTASGFEALFTNATGNSNTL